MMEQRFKLRCITSYLLQHIIWAFLCSSLSTLSTVIIIKPVNTNTESMHIASINPEAMLPFTSRAYSAEARPRKVKGKE